MHGPARLQSLFGNNWGETNTICTTTRTMADGRATKKGTITTEFSNIYLALTATSLPPYHIPDAYAISSSLSLH